MGRLIDEEELKKRLIKCTGLGRKSCELVLETMNGTPTAYDADTIQGNWRRVVIRNDKGGCIGAKMLCPVCNMDNANDKYMRFCPNCGARLEKYIRNEEE